MRIGVCIPCYAPHVPELRNCLASIEEQTRWPDVVSISVSGVSEIPDIPTRLPIRWTIDSAPHCAGSNRNRAAAAIQGEVDVLTFFDADDRMYPDRLRWMETHMEQSPIDVLLHSYVFVVKPAPPPPPPENRGILYRRGWTTRKEDLCSRVVIRRTPFHPEMRICNGHMACRTYVWQTLQYPVGYGLGEDSEYNVRLFRSGFRFGYTPDVLSVYLK